MNRPPKKTAVGTKAKAGKRAKVGARGDLHALAWPKAERTAEEIEAAAKVREQRRQIKLAEVAALRAVSPAAEVEGDPLVCWAASAKITATRGVMLEAPRLSGSGLPGSSLVVAARSFDGMGMNGGPPREYVLAFCTFLDGNGYKRRTQGVTFYGSELRDVARVLNEHADRLGIPRDDGTEPVVGSDGEAA